MAISVSDPARAQKAGLGKCRSLERRGASEIRVACLAIAGHQPPDLAVVRAEAGDVHVIADGLESGRGAGFALDADEGAGHPRRDERDRRRGVCGFREVIRSFGGSTRRRTVRDERNDEERHRGGEEVRSGPGTRRLVRREREHLKTRPEAVRGERSTRPGAQ